MESLLLLNISKLLIFIVKTYQNTISMCTTSNCRFFPSCSQYAIEVLKEYSLINSLYFICKRLLKCHPFHKGGYDSILIQDKNKREH